MRTAMIIALALMGAEVSYRLASFRYAIRKRNFVPLTEDTAWMLRYGAVIERYPTRPFFYVMAAFSAIAFMVFV